MNTHNVKCIRVNSTTRKVEYVDLAISESESWKDLETTHSTLVHLEGSKLVYFFHYTPVGPSMMGSPTPQDKGYVWITSDFNKDPEEIDDFSNHFIEGYGDGYITAHKKSRKQFDRGMPVDIDLTSEWVEKRVSEYTDGYNRQVPEFTCMISPKFDEPNEYELLLRIENKDRLYWQYETKFDKPVKQLTPQILTFSLEYNEITIIIGKIQDMSHQTRVMIIRNDQADLSQIASITIAAHKAPSWIKVRLEAYFRQIFFENKVVKNESEMIAHQNQN